MKSKNYLKIQIWLNKNTLINMALDLNKATKYINGLRYINKMVILKKYLNMILNMIWDHEIKESK